jgi:hypothetical protein
MRDWQGNHLVHWKGDLQAALDLELVSMYRQGQCPLLD